jgi:hypothetical protein
MTQVTTVTVTVDNDPPVSLLPSQKLLLLLLSPSAATVPSPSHHGCKFQIPANPYKRFVGKKLKNMNLILLLLQPGHRVLFCAGALSFTS